MKSIVAAWPSFSACLRRAGWSVLAAGVFVLFAGEAWGGRADRFDGLMQRGRAAMEDGLYELAERHFSRAEDRATRENDRVGATAWLARALISQQRPQAAVEAIRTRFGTVRETDEASDLLYWLARAHFEAGDDAEADSVLAARMELDADAAVDPEIIRLMGRIRYRQNRAGEAAEAFRRFDELYGEMDDALGNRLDWAAASLRAGHPEKAARLYEGLIEAADGTPEADEARLRLSELRWDEGHPEAVETLTEPLLSDESKDPRLRASAWLLRAHAARSAGNGEAARRAADAARETGDSESAWRARLLRIHIDLDEGLLEEAQEQVFERLAERPEDPELGRALLRLAEAYRRADRPDRGAELFLRHTELYGETAEDAAALWGRAWCLWDKEDFAEAARAFQRFADRTSDDSEKAQALIKVGDALYAADRMSEAYDAYIRFLDPFPDSTEAGSVRFQAASALVALEAYDRADAYYAEIEETEPNSEQAARASLQRGRLEEKRRRWGAAVEAYGRTLDRYSDSPEIYTQALLSRGLVRYKRGSFRSALADFENVAEGASAGVLREQGHFMRGWSLYLLGQEEAALSVCRDFVDRHPDSKYTPDVLFWLGENAFNRGDWDEAESIFLTLSTDHTDHELADRALYWAGRSAASGREYVRAIEHYGRLARVFPESPKLPEARFAQGDALSELGRFDEAILAYREILRRYPDSYLYERASGRIGDCHFTLAAEDPRRYEDALRSYQDVLDRPEAPLHLALQAEYKTGRCLEQMDRGDEAFERYMNVVYGHLEARREGRMGSPVWFARAGFRAGSIQERRGRWREAVSVYRRVAEAGGATAAEAQERILRIRREQWRIY